METKIIQLFGVAETQEIEKTFIEVLKEFSQKEIREKCLKPSTAEKHGYFIQNVERFLKKENKEGILPGEVRIKLMEEMQLWLQTSFHNCKPGHASRHAKLCRGAMGYAVRMEYVEHNPLSEIKLMRDKVKDVVSLEINELNTLINGDLKKKIKYVTALFLQTIDLYIFQCYTGLSYGDLYTYSLIKKDGRLWIENRRNKNNKPYYVPLFKQAEVIHNKYNGKLPRVTNQAYNKTLKRVAKEWGIDKILTTHTARKTFATHRDAEGWSTKTISDMLGNTLEIVQKHYLAKSSRRTENELVRLGL